MSRPIKETPILKGKEAKAFIKNKKANEGRKVSPEVKQRIFSNYEALNKIAQF